MYRILTLTLLAALLPALAGCRQDAGASAYAYTVREASTFEEVACRVYDDPARADVLRDANPRVRGPVLEPGTTLDVPPLATDRIPGTGPVGCQRVDTWWGYPDDAPQDCEICAYED